MIEGRMITSLSLTDLPTTVWDHFQIFQNNGNFSKQVCTTVKLVKSSTCLRAPHSSSPDAFCTQMHLYKSSTCLTQPISTLLQPQMPLLTCVGAPPMHNWSKYPVKTCQFLEFFQSINKEKVIIYIYMYVKFTKYDNYKIMNVISLIFVRIRPCWKTWPSIRQPPV